MLDRWTESVWRKKFAGPYVHIVFGARQTGKSTLIQTLLPAHAARVDRWKGSLGFLRDKWFPIGPEQVLKAA